MSTDHDHIQELLAGHALRALSGEDAAEAARALDEHVPACEDCRRTLAAFDETAADLALATPPVAPPDLLLARLHRDMAPRRAARSWHPGRVMAVAASVVLVVGVTGLALTRGGGPGSAQLAAADLNAAIAAAEAPDAETRTVGETTEVTVPDGFYLYGEDVPAPPPGQVYRLWLWSDGEPYYVGEFLPDDGTVAVRVLVDGEFDDVVVTVEDATTEPAAPGAPAWQSPAPTAA
ncbi:MAG TPA: anti-sigma factor [Actinomycetota bacterium]|nr:anti-sigma factor [Actinomycetota bacterium]